MRRLETLLVLNLHAPTPVVRGLGDVELDRHLRPVQRFLPTSVMSRFIICKNRTLVPDSLEKASREATHAGARCRSSSNAICGAWTVGVGRQREVGSFVAIGVARVVLEGSVNGALCRKVTPDPDHDNGAFGRRTSRMGRPQHLARSSIGISTSR